MHAHSALITAILERFGADPRCRLWKSPTGVASQGERTIRFGLPGSADITGILRGGRRVEIEAKTGAGRQSEQQKRFQAMVEQFGGCYVLARCVGDVEKALGGG